MQASFRRVQAELAALEAAPAPAPGPATALLLNPTLSALPDSPSSSPSSSPASPQPPLSARGRRRTLRRRCARSWRRRARSATRRARRGTARRRPISNSCWRCTAWWSSCRSHSHCAPPPCAHKPWTAPDVRGAAPGAVSRGAGGGGGGRGGRARARGGARARGRAARGRAAGRAARRAHAPRGWLPRGPSRGRHQSRGGPVIRRGPSRGRAPRQPRGLERGWVGHALARPAPRLALSRALGDTGPGVKARRVGVRGRMARRCKATNTKTPPCPPPAPVTYLRLKLCSYDSRLLLHGPGRQPSQWLPPRPPVLP